MTQIGSFNGSPVYEGELPDDLDLSRPWFLVPSRLGREVVAATGGEWPANWIEVGATVTDETYPVADRFEPYWPDAMRSVPAWPGLIGVECQPACLLMGESKHDD